MVHTSVTIQITYHSERDYVLFQKRILLLFRQSFNCHVLRHFANSIFCVRIKGNLYERITAAKKMLLTTTVSLQEIADATGFSNSSYFSKQFKNVQMTPPQYRNSSSTDIPEQKA